MGQPFFCFKIAFEAIGVYARVRSAASGNGNRRIEKRRDGFFYPLLNGNGVQLTLPSVICGAVIFQRDQIIVYLNHAFKKKYMPEIIIT